MKVLNFTKALNNMVRHTYLTEQLGELSIPDCIYNWVTAYLGDCNHETRYNGSVSATINIKARVQVWAF